ncbi:MAG: hypothetical protein WC542_00225 [Paludibacter sp.]|jgi:hypothetical protein
MKKSILFILISCFAMISTNLVQAELPVFSTNATTDAHWYRMKNAYLPTIPQPGYLKANADGSLSRANADATDDFLFCFVGDETNGFQIYNKALGAELVVTTLADWFNLIVVSSTPTFWTAGNYIWTFDANSNLKFMDSNNTSWYFRAPNDRLTVGATYYGGGDAVWNFEDSSTPIVVDKSALITLIAACNTQVNGDKADSQKATTFATSIATFEGTIAAAQAIVDNANATADDVTNAVVTLNYARTNYNMALVVLPFTLSTEGHMVWYKVINHGRDVVDQTGFLTYDGSNLIQTAATTADNQLWAFVGDNINGMNMYNKADFTDFSGVKLIHNGNFTMSADAWSGIWKVNSRIVDVTTYYGIFNANGAYINFLPDNYFFGYGGGTTGNVVYYGFADAGCIWSFAAASTGGTTSLDKNNTSKISVFSHDGIISVTGAKGMATIVTMTGATATFDTQKPYNVGGKGIYIVRVNGEVLKVIVK